MKQLKNCPTTVLFANRRHRICHEPEPYAYHGTRMMNLPNILTMSRLLFAGILVVILSISFPFRFILALFLFLIGGVTDALDGYLARKVYGPTDFGRLMDPLADKVMVAAVLISLVALRAPASERSLVPAWMVVIILSREFMVTGLRLLAAGKGRMISAGIWGKHKTTWQMVVIALILAGMGLRYDILAQDYTWLPRFDRVFGIVVYTMALAVTVLTVISGWVYYRDHRDLISDAK